ncbi:NusA-like transcription termination signal-binding factor [Nanoarchaeota archaeon]
MTRKIYDIETIKLISLFENITKSKLKDCFSDEKFIYFITQPGMLGKAIGKKAVNVKNLENKLNRKIKIIEFNPTDIQFVRNFIYPLKPKDIKKEGKIVIIEGSDFKTKSLLIGRDSQNLKNLKKVVKRYFEVDEIKII